MKYSWILFDADHTLYDFDHAESAALLSTFAEFGVSATAEITTAYREISTALFHQLENGSVSATTLKTERFRRLFAAWSIHLDVDRFSETYLQHLAQNDKLLPGAFDTVAELSKEVGLIIITNGLAEVQRPRFSTSALNGFFHDIIISDEVGAAKPDKQIFDAAFAAMGAPAREEVAIVGDSLTSDMRGGLDYGIDTCWFNPQGKDAGGQNHTYEITDLKEIAPILQQS